MKERVFSEFEKVFLLCALTLGLGACGQVALKRGADGADFAAAKTECESEARTPTEVDKCLQNKGWVVFDRDASSARAVTIEADAGVTDPLANTNQRVSVNGAQRTNEAESSTATAETAINSKAPATESGSLLSGISVSHTDNRPGVIGPAKSPESAKSLQKTPNKSPQYRETDLVQVASWWKWGGNGEALIADGTVCKETIGETAEASYNFSTLSVSVLRCLEKKGWRYLLAEQE